MKLPKSLPQTCCTLSVILGIVFGAISANDSMAGIESEKSSVSVMGWVRVPGVYPFKPGLTIQKTLSLAGGYAFCEDCAQIEKETGHHPSDGARVIVVRAGERIKVGFRDRPTFLLKPGDIIDIPHVPF